MVDDDPHYRSSMALHLAKEGYEISHFSSGDEAYAHLLKDCAMDAMLLDWRMPGMEGLELLCQLRQRNINLPVLILTAHNEGTNEEAALSYGAVDFIEKSRRPSIVLLRLKLILDGWKRPPGIEAGDQVFANILERGALTLQMDISRAFYHDQRVELTITEFQIVHFLAFQKPADASYRDIYDVVRGKGFAAGSGDNGYRVNVRSFIKRIRQKFREVDPKFDCIQNYAGFGYRWNDASDNETTHVNNLEAATALLPKQTVS